MSQTNTLSIDTNSQSEQDQVSSEMTSESFEFLKNTNSSNSPNEEEESTEIVDVNSDLLAMLGPSCKIANSQHVKILASYMKQMNKQNVDVKGQLTVVNVLLKTGNLRLLSEFIETKGLLVLKFWLKKASFKSDFLVALLKLLKLLPLTLEHVKDNLGKLVKVFSNVEVGNDDIAGKRCKALVDELMDKWRNLASQSVASKKKASDAPTIGIKRKKTEDRKTSSESLLFKPVEEPKIVKKRPLEKRNSLEISMTKISKASEEKKPSEPANTVEKRAISDDAENSVTKMMKMDSPLVSYRKEEPYYNANNREANESSEASSSKKKKSVRWKNGAQLTEIRYFEVDELIVKSHAKDSRNFDREEGVGARRAAMEEMEAVIPWSIPKSIDSKFSRGAGSKQKKIQAEREMSALSAVYYSKSDIPPSPAEPVPDIDGPIPDRDIPPIPPPVLSTPSLSGFDAANLLKQFLPMATVPAQPVQQPIIPNQNIANLLSSIQGIAIPGLPLQPGPQIVQQQNPISTVQFPPQFMPTQSFPPQQQYALPPQNNPNLIIRGQPGPYLQQPYTNMGQFATQLPPHQTQQAPQSGWKSIPFGNQVQSQTPTPPAHASPKSQQRKAGVPKSYAGQPKSGAFLKPIETPKVANQRQPSGPGSKGQPKYY